MRVNMHDAKTNLSRLVAAVESGEADEVEIARAGHVVARIAHPALAPLGGRATGQGAYRSTTTSTTYPTMSPPRSAASSREGPPRYPHPVVVAR